jgi:hypothetical protein
VITTALHVEETGMLMCDVFKHRDEQRIFLYTFAFLKLNGNEFNMNGGRFREFVRKRQAYATTLVISGANIGTISSLIKPHTGVQVEIIDWINDNLDSSWSLAVHPIDADRMNMEFSFADQTEAAFFALRWH